VSCTRRVSVRVAVGSFGCTIEYINSVLSWAREQVERGLRMKNKGLTASLALNVVLAAIAAVAFVSQGADDASSTDAPPAPQDDLRASVSQTIDARRTYEGLRALGLSDDSAQRALVGVLQSQRQPALAEYWRSSHVRQIQERLDQYRADAAVRATVLDAFGPTAVEAAGLAAVFKPLQSEFPTLSSQQQLAILAVERSVDEERLGQLTQPAAGVLAPTLNSARDRLVSILNSADLLEYDLRRSMTAQRLAASGFAFTEHEFRDVFAIYSSNANVKDGAQLQSASGLEPKLRDALGAERYELFARSQDPAFRTLASIGRLHGLSQEKVEAAYRIVRKAAQEPRGIGPRPVVSFAGKGSAKLDERSAGELMAVLGPAAYEQYASSVGVSHVRTTLIASPSLN
jgi:hypothetical protein